METIFKSGRGLRLGRNPSHISKKFLTSLSFVFKYFNHYVKKRAINLHAIRFVGICCQRLLYYGAIALTLVTLAIAAIYIHAQVQNYINEQEKIFFAQKDAVISAIKREELHLKGVIGFHKILQPMWDTIQHAPLHTSLTAKYQRLLRKNHNIVIAGSDLASEPYFILSTLTENKDTRQLKELLKIVRTISPMSDFHLSETGVPLDGFVYGASKPFLAISPSQDVIDAFHEKGIHSLQSFVLRETRIVEQELAKYSSEALKAGKVVWVPFHWDSFIKKTVAHYAGVVFQGNERVGVIVFNICAKDFPLFFLSKMREMSNFFVIARDRSQFFGIQKNNPEQMRFANIVLQHPKLFGASAAKVQLIKKEGSLFFAQRILGPDWVAVYALDWHTILSGLKQEMMLVLILVFGVLALLWIFVFIFERYIFSPIQARSQWVCESEQFNRTIISMAPVGLSVIEAETGKVVIKNDIATRLLKGWAEDDKPSPKLLTIYHDTIQQANQVNSANKANRTLKTDNVDNANGVDSTDRKDQQDIFYNEITTVQENGKQGHVAVSFSRSRYQGRDVVLCGLNDISSRKETERLLLEAKRSADQASQAKSMFLASMGHEIRTPLHGALGHLELLSRETLKPSQRELVGTIGRSFESLLTLLNDILDFSKIEAGELKLEFSTIQLISLIERCARTFAPLILKKGVHFFCLLDPRLRDRLIGNGDRVQQILMNLLSNATKFTDVGKILLKADVLEENGHQYRVRFQVADSGIGIAKQNQQKLFFPFTQANTAIAQCFGGTGLGLSLCKKLCTLMGGNISLISEEGFGSVFTVELPFKLPEQIDDTQQPVCEANGEVESKASEARILAEKTVLLLCNTALWRDSLVERFELWGATVSVVERMEDIEPTAYPSATMLVIAQSGANPHGELEEHKLEEHNNVIYYFRAPILISASGPYQPEYRRGIICISSLSLNGLKKAIAQSILYQEKLDEVQLYDAFAQSKPQLELCEPITPTLTTTPVAHKPAILVVEDDAVNRKLLLCQLRAIGYSNIGEAIDGKEAFSKCKKQTYDVILTDLSMPHMNGFSLVQALQNAQISTPVIIITASTVPYEDTDKNVNQGMGIINMDSKGIANILYKPVSISQLKDALEKIFVSNVKNEVIVTDKHINKGINKNINTNAQWIDLQLKEVFIQSWQNDLLVLQRAFHSGDNEALLHQLHKLKGALMVMNERRLIRLCTKIQHTCAAKGIEAVQTLYRDFEKWMADTVRKYQLES